MPPPRADDARATPTARSLAALTLGGVATFVLAAALSPSRQRGYSVVREHLSGLAALDARAPALMITGFVALGVGAIAFAALLHRVLARPVALPRWRVWLGPALVATAGVGLVLVGAFRRDCVLLEACAQHALEGQSWHNDLHDAAAGITYLCLVAAPVALAPRLRASPGWEGWAAAGLAAGVLTGSLLLLFASGTVDEQSGVLQRVIAAVPLLWIIAFSGRVLFAPGAISSRAA